MSPFSPLVFCGGLAFFFFGMSYARQGLQLLAGDRLRIGLAHLTRNRFTALGFGSLVTLLLQSSTATILMLMSLASTGLLTLRQAFGVILGADIGTTLVVVLLAIRQVADYSLLFVFLGFLLELFFKNAPRLRSIGRVLFGFGAVFFGMKLMTQTSAPLALDPDARILFGLMANHPLILLLVSVLFTILIQTSAATIGIAIALGLGGVIDLPQAIPIVLGANVGTCFSSIIASFTGDANGKRIALAHLLVKVVGVTCVFPFLAEIAGLLQALSLKLAILWPGLEMGMGGQIALAHLIFNLGLAILFLPLLSLGVALVGKLVPEQPQKKFAAKYLDPKALDTPSLAFAQARQELLRVAEFARELYRDCLGMFEANGDFEKGLNTMDEKDDRVDFLEKEVRFYLAKLTRETLTDAQAAQMMALLTIGADWEGIGDIITKELAQLAKKKREKGRVFSKEGWQELQKLHQVGLENFTLAVSCFAAPSEELWKRMQHHGERFKELEESLRESHIGRLHSQQPETFETSSIHLDLLGNLRRINSHLMHLAFTSLKS